MITLKVNGKSYQEDVDADSPLLWVIREHMKLTGTKFGCGKGVCGACTVLIDGKADRSCQLRVGELQGKTITTIEGLPDHDPVKAAWVEEQVPQCGYCQPGQIMQAIDLLRQHPSPTEEQIKRAMKDNLCRCGTYPKIIKAIIKAGKGVR